MHPSLERTRRLIAETAGGASAAALARHPEGKWSSAEILEHLSLAYSGTVYVLRKCLSQGTPLGHPPTFKQRVATWFVVGFGRFRKIEAPRSTRPTGLAPLDALQAAERQLAAMDEALAACEARFGPRVIITDHPRLGGFTVGQWRRFHWQHTRHHAKQIADRL